jgi:hypothetical protein
MSVRLCRLCCTLAAALLAGCASVRVRGDDSPARTGRNGLGIPARTTADPTLAPADAPRGDVPSATPHATASESRRVCRSGSWPSGWIAVAYEAASGDECPKGNTGYPVAVLVRYTSQPKDATLDVCADQRVPQSWTAESESTDVGQCPGAERDGRSATKRIRRRW